MSHKMVLHFGVIYFPIWSPIGRRLVADWSPIGRRLVADLDLNGFSLHVD
jgi:hypothetical protein